MLNRNETQKNFKQQINEIEKQMSEEENQGKGAFVNIHYKERFYGKDYDKDTTKLKRFLIDHKSTIRFFIYAVIVLGSFTAFSLIDEPFMSPYARADKYYEEGNYEKALKSIDRLLLVNRKDYNLLYNKGMALIELERYDEAIEVFRRAEKLSNNDADLYEQLGYAYFQSNNFKESINAYKRVQDITPKNAKAMTWIAYNNIMLENYDEAMALVDRALEIDKELPSAYFTKGEANYYKNKYKEAIGYYEIAIEKDSSYVEAYINKLSSLYMIGEYSGAIEFGLEASKLFAEESEIPYYIADAYSALGEGENAIKYYKSAIELNNRNVSLIARLGWEYLYEEDYTRAKEYLGQALELDYTNKDAVALKKALVQQERPEAEKIVDFVKENYLYFDRVSEFDKKAEAFIAKDKVTNEDIKSFLNSIKIKEDSFTFTLHDKQYEDFVKDNYATHISSEMLDDKNLYVRISTFVPKVDIEFRNIINKLSNTTEKNLIIDLRDNGGGLSSAANNILDFLLPESTISYMIDRKGRIADYYSGESHTKFNKIVVLVNENSASSSELLALGLKKHLNNVTIIGKPTFGKGVGQISYENKAQKFSVFLVSFYWNVKEKNIAGDKIYPDIDVSSSRLEDYLKTTKETILKP
jgi:tetratricopeptide (TPR) repeat protein